MIKEDPADKIFEATAKLFHVPNSLYAEIDFNLNYTVKNLPFLSRISKNIFLQGYIALQGQVKEYAGQIENEDCVAKILDGLVENPGEFSARYLQKE